MKHAFLKVIYHFIKLSLAYLYKYACRKHLSQESDDLSFAMVALRAAFSDGICDDGESEVSVPKTEI